MTRKDHGTTSPSDAFGAERVKAHNQSLIFNLIRSEQAMSRAALTKRTGMSPTSIGRIVGELVAEGFIREIGMSTGGLGRRATLLELNPDGLLAIGVSLDVPKAHVGITNLAGRAVVEVQSCVIDPHAAPEQISEKLIAILTTLWEGLTADQRMRVSGIGVTVPGQVLWPTGVVSQSPQLGWRQYPMQEAWQAKLKLPVYVENDVKAAALAEGLFGAAIDVEDYVVVKIGSGLGAAIVTGGELLRGQGNLAGELGHMIVAAGGVRCDCGRYGCLQTYVCMSALERQGNARLSELLLQADQQQELATQLLQQARDLLAQWTANLACLYNTRKALFYGELFEVWPGLLQQIEERMPHYLWDAEHSAFTISTIDGAYHAGASSVHEETILVRAAASQVFHDKLARQLSSLPVIAERDLGNGISREQDDSILQKGR